MPASYARRQIEKRAFICGFAAAVASVARDHGQDDIAEMLIEASGYTLKDFESAAVDDYDLDALRPLLALKLSEGTSRAPSKAP